MLGSAMSFSLMAVAVKAVGDRLPVAEVVLARAVVSLVLSWWMVRRAGIEPWGRRRGLLTLRGVIGSAGLFCVFAALTRLPLAAATVLQYLYPTLSALFGRLLLGERVGGRLVPALLLGWSGVMFTARPDLLGGAGGPGGEALPAVGVAIAIAGALLTALAYVTVRELGRSEDPRVIVLYFPLVSVPLTLPFVLLDPVLPTAGEAVLLLAVGILTQLGQVGLTHAITRLPVARATTISYAQVGLAWLWGWAIFAEPVTAGGLLGALLVLAATLLGIGPPRRG
jgi:drug/metabolite transporter (DMT)-like permease